MYKIIFTKGDTETVIAEFDSLEKAKDAAKDYGRRPEYCDGLITVEVWRDTPTGKSRRIY